jgi:hypothetical protein
MQNPWMQTVTLTSANTNYRLYDLMQAIDSGSPLSVNFLQLQANPGGSGAKYYIGNSNVSATDNGVELTAGQSQTFQDQSGNNLISTASIYLRSDTASQTFNVIAVQH